MQVDILENKCCRLAFRRASDFAITLGSSCLLFKFPLLNGTENGKEEPFKLIMELMDIKKVEPFDRVEKLVEPFSYTNLFCFQDEETEL